MSTLVHVDGVRGINLDLLAEWHYEEKKPGLQKRSSDGESQEPGARMRITFTTGYMAEFTGIAAEALHRHLTTKSRSLI